MSKKIFVPLIMIAFTLSGCQFAPITSGSNNSNNDSSTNSSSENTSSKESSSSSSSKSNTSSYNNPIEKTDLKYTYKDFSNNYVYGSDGSPSEGSVKYLIIPVWFTDSSTYIKSAYKEQVREDIKTAYLGTTSETGWQSVKTFYEVESFGNLSIDATVSEWYEPGVASSKYQSDDDYGTETSKFVQSTVEWYFNNHTSDKRSNYDADKNGYLDGVMLIYAVPNYSNRGLKEDNLWAYCTSVYDEDGSLKNVTNPGVNMFFWASYDFMYGSGSDAKSRTGTTYGYGDTSNCTIDAHTYIHEMGHIFNLDDYYDYGSYGYCPAGGFSMQDYNVGGHDPYSLMSLGWASPYIPETSMEITISTFQESHDLILLTPSFNSEKSPFDEYLLLELYSPTGLNKFDCDHRYDSYPVGPSKVGIRLWHVDARLAICTGQDKYGDLTFAQSLVSDPTTSSYYGIAHAMSNSTGSSKSGYYSALGSTTEKYSLLQLIRNDESESYRSKNALSSDDLFFEGDSFDISTYKSQFANSGKLDSGKTFPWSFTVASLSSTSATISLTRN